MKLGLAPLSEGGGATAGRAGVVAEKLPRHHFQESAAPILESGAGYRIRTYDPLITNQVLYQLS